MAGSQPDTAFRKLIEALFDEQQAAWSAEKPNEMPSRQSLDVKNVIRRHQKGWQELSDERMLPTKLPNIVEFEIDRYLMPLPPLQKDGHLVAWLSVSYKHSDAVGAKFEEACCRIYVLMLGRDSRDRLIGTGFRIESPERNCQEDSDADRIGRHDFYHAQLIKKIATHGPEFGAPDWLPCTQPSFPLLATQPVEALLNLILTLYGANYYKEFLKRHLARIGDLPMSPEFQRLHGRLQGVRGRSHAK